MIDYVLIERHPLSTLFNGQPRAQVSPYTVSFNRLGFKNMSIDPTLRVNTIPLLNRTYVVQHHGINAEKRTVQGNIRLDAISTLQYRSLREHIAEQEIRRLQWLANHGILCTLFKYTDTTVTIEILECYISRGLKLSMTSSIAGEPLLRSWSFELTAVYSETNEADIFNGEQLVLPDTQLPKYQLPTSTPFVEFEQ